MINQRLLSSGGFEKTIIKLYPSVILTRSSVNVALLLRETLKFIFFFQISSLKKRVPNLMIFQFTKVGIQLAVRCEGAS